MFLQSPGFSVDPPDRIDILVLLWARVIFWIGERSDWGFLLIERWRLVMKRLILAPLVLTVGLSFVAAEEVTNIKGKQAVIETNVGKIVVDFYPDDAPNTVANFIKLADQGFYDGLIFHRVIKGFMIQGGCPKGDGTGGPGYTIKAEFNSRKHVAGTVAMARTNDPDSAGSQFYICLAPQPFLDGKYTVFGQVTQGQDVVTKIGDARTDANDRPLQKVVIEKVRIVEK
jgi:cyclophilin family peptidyl-prolyl cis-trans isomerase